MANVQVPSKMESNKVVFHICCIMSSNQDSKSCICNVSLACENVTNIPKRTATPRAFSPMIAAANRTAENICTLTEVSLIACSLKLFSWQKFVSAL